MYRKYKYCFVTKTSKHGPVVFDEIKKFFPLKINRCFDIQALKCSSVIYWLKYRPMKTRVSWWCITISTKFNRLQ